MSLLPPLSAFDAHTHIGVNDPPTYAREFPRARFIPAHAGVSDLAWIWQRVADHPNVLFDTAWYSAADLRALFALVPPGQVLYATDVPFGAPMQGMILAFRAALQAGLTGEQIAVVAGGQLERLVAGEELIDAGPPPGVEALRSDPLLDRVNHYLVPAFGSLLAGGSSSVLRRRRSVARSSRCSISSPSLRAVRRSPSDCRTSICSSLRRCSRRRPTCPSTSLYPARRASLRSRWGTLATCGKTQAQRRVLQASITWGR